MNRTTLDALQAARAAKRPVVLATNLANGDQSLIDGDIMTGVLAVNDDVREAAREALRSDRSRTVEHGDKRIFLHAYNPPLRMLIVGAVHISQALAPMAETTGYDVVVIDPRGAWATDDRFPNIALNREWPDDAINALKPDTRTAIITLTHDPKLDDPALDRALKSDCFYIGSLGSTRTHARRLERLTEMGFNDQDLSRIHGPIGLNIGAKSPAEIAVSILGQVTDALRRP